MKKAKKSATFWRWVLSYLAILLLCVAAMAVVTAHTLDLVKKEVTSVYAGALDQMKMNMDDEFEAAHAVALTTAADSRIQSLAYADEFTAHHYQTMGQIQMDIQKYAATNDMIESIFIYFPDNAYMLGNAGHYNSRRMKEYFSMTHGLGYTQYAAYLESYHYMDMVTLSGTGERETTFIMHSVLPAGQENSGRAIVILALDMKALEEEMSHLNDSVDSRMWVLLDDSAEYDEEMQTLMPQEDFQRVLSGNSIQLTLDNSLLFAVSSDVQKAHYLLHASLDTFNRETYSTLWVMVVCIAICVLLGVTLAVILSRRQYKPLQQLASLVGDGAPGSGTSDEYQYIASGVGKIRREMQEIRGELTRREAAVKRVVMTRLLNGRFATIEQADEPLMNAGVRFKSEAFIVISFQIRDNEALFFETSENAWQNDEMSMLIIQNIAEELAAERHSGCCCEVQDKAILILSKNIDCEEKTFLPEAAEIAGKVVALTAEKFNLHLIASVSGLHFEAAGIAAAYRETAEIDEYAALIEANDAVTTWEAFSAEGSFPASSEPNIPEWCTYFVSLIRTGSYAQALRSFDELVDRYLPPNLNNLVLAKCRVFTLINQLIVSFEDLKEEFGEEFWEKLAPSGSLLHSGSVSAMKLEVSRIVNDITNYYVEHNPAPSRSRIEQIKRYVQEHYSDPNLSAAVISDEFEMNPAYLSRFFKKSAGTGVLDYIHEVRISHAKLLMAETEESIKDISEKVGYYNSLTFIRAFKRQEGCTPGQYRESIGLSGIH